MTSTVFLVPTGAGNLASLKATCRRLGYDCCVAQDAQTVVDAERVIVPGVGAFGAAMRFFEATGMADALRRRVELDRPLVCICLGMQVLATQSEESPGVPGLGVLDLDVAGEPTVVKRLPAFGEDRLPIRVPHLGWNRVESERLGRGDATFAHSFALLTAPRGCDVAWTEITAQSGVRRSSERPDQGVRFVSGLARGALVAFQWHPEISGRFGMECLGRALKLARAHTDETELLSC